MKVRMIGDGSYECDTPVNACSSFCVKLIPCRLVSAW